MGDFSSFTIDLENNQLICTGCVEWTHFDDLYVDESGQKWDVCKTCKETGYVA